MFFSLRSPIIVIVGVILTLFLTGYFGKKDDSVPYYAFTEQDKAWLNQTSKSEWKFANGKGQERRFQIDTVATDRREERTGSMGILLGNNKLRYTYDVWYMHIVRTDSTTPAGYFEFTTAIRHESSKTGLAAAGQWYSYIGTEHDANYTECQKIYFGDVQAKAYQQLTINGRRYERVLLLESNGSPVANCFYPYPTRTTTRRIYYDQAAGIVRMEDKNGEVWNRIL